MGALLNGGESAVGNVSAGACMSAIQRINGVRSATSTIYQSFLLASQRAPNALAASFSANGVTKLILMLRLGFDDTHPRGEGDDQCAYIQNNRHPEDHLKRDLAGFVSEHLLRKHGPGPAA